MEELWHDLPGSQWFLPSSWSLSGMSGAHPGHCATLLGGEAARDSVSLVQGGADSVLMSIRPADKGMNVLFPNTRVLGNKVTSW